MDENETKVVQEIIMDLSDMQQVLIDQETALAQAGLTCSKIPGWKDKIQNIEQKAIDLLINGTDQTDD